jgi:quinol monooxygenase YgiN
MASSQLFVYFRVRTDHVPAAVAALRQLHSGWGAEDAGLQCELLQRVDEAAGHVTLMEVYRHARGMVPAWQGRIEREAGAALARWLVGQRHQEVFAPCA